MKREKYDNLKMAGIIKRYLEALIITINKFSFLEKRNTIR